MKKQIFRESPTQSLPQLCEMCGNEISDGDECYYMGDGVFICEEDKCVEEWNT